MLYYKSRQSKFSPSPFVVIFVIVIVVIVVINVNILVVIADQGGRSWANVGAA